MGISERNLISIFNSPVELGTRICLILSSVNRPLDLDQLVFFDYALLYSNEFNGPPNLHPALPNHRAEILHRRETFPNALKLFLSKGLINLKHSHNGRQYSASDTTDQFIGCLKTGYYKKMWERLIWLESSYNFLNSESVGILRSLGTRQ